MSEKKAMTGRPPATERVAAGVDRFVARLARHWLAVFNGIVAVFLFLPFLAPALMHSNTQGLGRLIYTIYSPTCHQLPERSFFLFGPRVVYSVADLEKAGVIPAGLSPVQRLVLRFPGAAEIGYKVAICERDVAIYGGILLGGLLFGAVRGRLRRPDGQLRKLPLKFYAIALVPIAIDGVTQLLGLRESTWLLRVLTGGLFGLATAWFVYPIVQDAMDDILKTTAATAPLRTAAEHGVRIGQKEPPEI
jgi:uncharacterized membrane protein